MSVNFGLGNKLTAQELKVTGIRLFEASQYVEATPLLKSAAEALPEDEYLTRLVGIEDRTARPRHRVCQARALPPPAFGLAVGPIGK